MSLIRNAFRSLTASPLLTTIAIASLALGIGANTAIYSLLDQMLLRAMPVPEPQQLVNMAAPGPKPGSQSCGQAGGCDEVFSYLMFRDLEAADIGFSGVAAHVGFGANIAHPTQTVSGSGLLVSGSYFPVLGVRPALGRLLGPDDDRVIGEHFVAVLSYNFWANQLGSDRSILNQSMVINGLSMTIVGVAGQGFEGTTLGSRPDVFVPITMRQKLSASFGGGFDNRTSYWAYVFGRLESGVSLEQAQARTSTFYRGVINEVEADLQEGMSEETLARFREKPILLSEGHRGQSSLHEEVGTPMALLMTITGLVLLIACANIANLLLARGAARSQEMAVRGALGASRRRLLTQLLADALLLAALGGIASLVFAHWTLQLIASMLPPQALSSLSLEIQTNVVWLTALLSMGTGLLFGLYPALHSTRSDLMTLIRAGSGQPSGARSAARFRTVLVTAQIALSMALLVSAGFFLKSLHNVGQVDLGLDPNNTVVFSISPARNGYEPQASLALYEQLEDRLKSLPGVTGVSQALVRVLGGSSWGNDVSVEGFQSGPDVDDNSRMNKVGPNYFSTLSIPLLAGREFSAADGPDTSRVAIVNTAFTKKFGLDGANALGKFMSDQDQSTDLDIEIVGVIGGAKYSDVKDEAPPVYFLPYRQDDSVGTINFYVRTTLAPEDIMKEIRGVVTEADANLPIEDLQTLEQQIDENIVLDRVVSTLAAAFAVIATLMASIGLYGVIAYSVAQRTREFGIRMALGAGHQTIRGMVIRQVGKLVLIGGGLGLIAALALGRAVQSLLYGVEPYDPLIVLAVASLLFGVALAAGYGPARRASRVDPMGALRYE